MSLDQLSEDLIGGVLTDLPSGFYDRHRDLLASLKSLFGLLLSSLDLLSLRTSLPRRLRPDQIRDRGGAGLSWGEVEEGQIFISPQASQASDRLNMDRVGFGLIEIILLLVGESQISGEEVDVGSDITEVEILCPQDDERGAVLKAIGGDVIPPDIPQVELMASVEEIG